MELLSTSRGSAPCQKTLGFAIALLLLLTPTLGGCAMLGAAEVETAPGGPAVVTPLTPFGERPRLTWHLELDRLRSLDGSDASTTTLLRQADRLVNRRPFERWPEK